MGEVRVDRHQQHDNRKRNVEGEKGIEQKRRQRQRHHAQHHQQQNRDTEIAPPSPLACLKAPSQRIDPAVILGVEKRVPP